MDISGRAALFAERVAAIAFFEWKGTYENADCLVLGKGEEADALEMLLSSRCRSVDRERNGESRYDLIFLTDAFDPALLKNSTGRETLVVDAALTRGRVGYFDPTMPFRQVRVISLSISENSSVMQDLQ